MLPVRLSDTGFPVLRKDPLQWRLDCLELCSWNLLEILSLYRYRVPLDELIAAQVNLTFELIPWPVRYSVSDEFPIALLRDTPVLPNCSSNQSVLKNSGTASNPAVAR
jgi:hypothetical protein